MQDADVILSMLSQKSARDCNYVFDRLYRNLFNPDLYMLAYHNLYAHPETGTAIPKAGEKTIDGPLAQMVEETIALLRQERYYPQPVRYPDPSEKSGIRAFSRLPRQDQLVLEILCMLLQGIYEPIFRDSSHGFRPARSRHTALVQAKTCGRGSNWVIEGTIKSFFEHLNYRKLRHLLSKKINDGRFLNLLDRFIRAGYLALPPLSIAQSYPPTEIAPRGMLSSILLNIYLHELDLYMERVCAQPIRQLAYPVHTDYTAQPSYHYVRYADSFVVMIAASKSQAQQLCQQLKNFLVQDLELELENERDLLANLADQRVRFLAYEMARTRRSQAGATSQTTKAGLSGESIQLLVPADVIREQLKPFVENGKAVHHNARLNLPLLTLLRQYNAEISSLYNYYCLATNVSGRIGKFKYYHYTSLVKTVARKEQCSVARVINKYGVDVKLKQGTGTHRIFGLPYQTLEGKKILTYFNHPLVRQDSVVTTMTDHV